MSEENEKSNQEFDPKDVAKFRKWKKKVKDPTATLRRQADLRSFREQYGVEKSSNFHCPWCFNGKLYFNEEEDFYVCRDCEIKFRIDILTPELLGDLIKEKRLQRLQDKESREEEKRHGIGVPQEAINHLRSI